MHKLPKIRESLLIQDLADEILIYDLNTDRMLCLNSTARTVFNACNGSTGFDELKIESNLTGDLIFLALDELNKQNLLAEDYASPFAGISRREAIKRVGLGTMLALPIITALAAPTAAQTASNCVAQNQNCIFNDFKQSNCCPNFRCNSASANTCQACTNSNAFYYQTFGGNTDQATCNARPERNRCCNAAATPVTSGTSCLCG